MTDNTKVFNAFTRDLERYKKETGKATNEVLASRALDFSIKFSKEMKRRAPSREEIDNEAKAKNYAIHVRKSIVKSVGGFKGKTRRRVQGRAVKNKRAVAVAKELAKRRSSVTFLSRSIAKWKSSLNKGIEEKEFRFGRAFTRRKTSEIGSTKGSFSAKRDVVIVRSQALGLGKANKIRREVTNVAFKEASRGIRQFLDKRIGREYGKNIKRVYR